MLRFIVRRLLLLVPIILGLSILIFLWIRALPGGPTEALLGERATPEAVAQIRHQLGLDKPIYQQYWAYVRTTAAGNLGISISSRRPVTTEIRERFPATVELAFSAMIFALALGLPLGFYAAKRHGSTFDHLSLVGSLIGISIPIFFLAIILKYIFSVRLGWLPSVGRQDVLIDAPASDRVLRPRRDRDVELERCMGRDPASDPARDRARLDPARDHRADHSRLRARRPERGLRAHGPREGDVAGDRRPASRDAKRAPAGRDDHRPPGRPPARRAPCSTETVFAIPGMGSWLAQAIFNRDYPVIQGGVLFLAIVFVIVNLIVDLSYGFLNPRIRVS